MEHVNEKEGLVSEKLDVIKMSMEMNMNLKEVLRMLGVSVGEGLNKELRHLLSEVEPSDDLKSADVLLTAARETSVEPEALEIREKCRYANLRKRLSKVAHSGDRKDMYVVYKDSIGTPVEKDVWEELLELYKK